MKVSGAFNSLLHLAAPQQQKSLLSKSLFPLFFATVCIIAVAVVVLRRKIQKAADAKTSDVMKKVIDFVDTIKTNCLGFVSKLTKPNPYQQIKQAAAAYAENQKQWEPGKRKQFVAYVNFIVDYSPLFQKDPRAEMNRLEKERGHTEEVLSSDAPRLFLHEQVKEKFPA